MFSKEEFNLVIISNMSNNVGNINIIYITGTTFLFIVMFIVCEPPQLKDTFQGVFEENLTNFLGVIWAPLSQMTNTPSHSNLKYEVWSKIKFIANDYSTIILFFPFSSLFSSSWSLAVW